MSHKSTKSLKPAPEMDDQEEIYPNLPPEIILNILSRIPIKTVFTCKCVCKSWLELLKSPEFARSHLSNSVPGLLIQYRNYRNNPKTDIFKIFGFEDTLAIERHELHYKRVLKVTGENTFGDSYPCTIMEGSTNGLLFLQKSSYCYVCNPITHECLRLPKPERISTRFSVETHGFGMSRLSNQYKVVKIFHDEIEDDHVSSIPEIVCQVYTLGTGSWRSITAPRETLVDYSTGKLLNGNLHWLTFDSMRTRWISVFDIETEVFTRSRAPMLECEESLIEIGVLRDRLCVSETLSTNEIVIYLMTDDGHEKESWNKEYVISGSKVNEIHPGGPDSSIDAMCLLKACLLKAFRDGDLLLMMDGMFLLCYSSRTKTVALVDVLNKNVHQTPDPILYTPSFISLKDFETENAKSIEFVCSMR